MKGVDPKVYELAEYFVPQDEVCRKETVQELAEHIQQAVEDFMAEDDKE
jgi:hypothetical protein